jgi:hypothetical protein
VASCAVHDLLPWPVLVLQPPQGTALSLVQDLPISKPCTPSEIDQLAAAKEVATLCPFYLDLKSAGQHDCFSFACILLAGLRAAVQHTVKGSHIFWHHQVNALQSAALCF